MFCIFKENSKRTKMLQRWFKSLIRDSSFTIAIFFAVFSKLCTSLQTDQNPLVQLPLEERIRHHGYRVELYHVTTEDDYILTLYRIPGRVDEHPNQTKNKSIVLLLHGLGGTPQYFFMMGNDSIGLGLVQQGFEVWALCARGMDCGNKKKHKTLDWDKDKSFWKYTMTEMGYYDIAAGIDFITNKTDQEKVFLLGHSAGSTLQLIFLSMRPEYNQKVKISTSYAGTVFLSHARYPFLKLLGSLGKFGKGIWFNVFNEYEFYPKEFGPLIVGLIQSFCNDPKFSRVCVSAIGIAGSHKSVLTDAKKYLPFIVHDVALRISAMLIFHYADIISSGRFMMYDYGRTKNLKMYGQETPSDYNLTQVTCPTAFFSGPNDDLSTNNDRKQTISNMPNVIYNYVVPFKKFNHVDFIFAHNASKLVYEPTYELFKNYDKGIVPTKVKMNWRKRFANKNP